MTPEERQASIEATATERAATLNPNPHHVSIADLHKRVAELEGKPIQGDPANDFHVKANSVENQHGESRAKFIQKLVANNLVDEGALPLFLKYLNEYEVDGSGEPPYDVADIAQQGQALNKPLEERFTYTDRWDTGFAQEGDPYGIGKNMISQSFHPDAAFTAQGEFERVAREAARVDVRPSEEKENG